MADDRHAAELVAVGRAIRAFREDRGMSAEDLAAAAGRPVRTVEAVEDGRDELRFDLLCALADGLDIRLSAITVRVAEES
jgi:XRE family transcriptional regulator, fatty acid utilization regulator